MSNYNNQQNKENNISQSALKVDQHQGDVKSEGQKSAIPGNNNSQERDSDGRTQDGKQHDKALTPAQSTNSASGQANVTKDPAKLQNQKVPAKPGQQNYPEDACAIVTEDKTSK